MNAPQLQAVAAILKKRFPNLTVDETIRLSTTITATVLAHETVEQESKPKPFDTDALGNPVHTEGPKRGQPIY